MMPHQLNAPTKDNQRRIGIQQWTLALILGVHSVLLAWSSYTHSPTNNEAAHLPAGISHWTRGQFDLFRVNPPLVRMVGALPVLLAEPKLDWSRYSTDLLTRAEHEVSADFIKANGGRVFWLFVIARWMCIPFSLLGGVVCYCWARQLYGTTSGLVACALWCFSPDVLGHGSLMMPDIPAAALGAAACYTFWRWLRQPTWSSAILSGLILGFAELAKTTLIVLYPLWPILWLTYRLSNRTCLSPANWASEACMLIVRMVLGIYVVNLCYGFEGTLRPLGEYQFQSQTLTGISQAKRPDAPVIIGNRFSASWLGKIPVPLPMNFVQGIDTQKVDFEKGMESYLGGVWSDRGWWYFYLYAAAVKLPIGTLLALLLGIGTLILSGRSLANLHDELQLITPMLIIVAMVSSQSGISVHFRYIFPALPFLFVLASRWAADWSTARWNLNRVNLKCVGTAAISWSILSSCWFYPHSLSYFNELAGGPIHGARHLVNSSIDWGQDLLNLKQWIDRNPDKPLSGLLYFGGCPSNALGINAPPLPMLTSNAVHEGAAGQLSEPLLPGWYAISVNALYRRRGEYKYLLRFSPETMIGYSIYVYHLTAIDVMQLEKQELATTRN